MRAKFRAPDPCGDQIRLGFGFGIDFQRLEDADMHRIGADENRQFDDLTVAEMATQGLEDGIGHLYLARHGIGISERRTVALALVSLVIIMFWPKRWSRVPGSIVAVAAGMLIVQLYHRLGWATDTIGSRFGGIPQGLPPFHFPGLDLEHLSGLIRPAITIALLGAIVIASADRKDSSEDAP